MYRREEMLDAGKGKRIATGTSYPRNDVVVTEGYARTVSGNLPQKKGARLGAPMLYLAAAAVIVAAVIVVVAAHIGAATAVAEQQNQNDDPANITTAEIIVAHKKYLQNDLTAGPFIP